MSDARGEYLVEWINALNISGNIPTFVRGAQTSFIDVTLATQDISRKVTNWEVSTQESMSLHRLIFYEVTTNVNKRIHPWREQGVINKDEFRDTISLLTMIDAHELGRAIKIAQEQCTRRLPKVRRKQPVWWNEAISEARSKCNRLRRMIQRARIARVEGRITATETEYKEARKSLRGEIRRSQREQWRELCDGLEDDPWGQGYQIVMGKIKQLREPYEMDEETKTRKIRELFPDAGLQEMILPHVLEENQTSPFTLEELQLAKDKMKLGKAPGPDGIRLSKPLNWLSRPFLRGSCWS
ncbi:uncharacterized protein [Leptinotarsa decemlineata]|uniref:uncharacterized protein n=1 Tax=Leptinotarsa decemlineata TaxID=7539 RepID=UPI003D306DE3